MAIEYLKEEEVFNKIKETILNYYPILENRANILFHKYSEFEININFLKDENGENITRISFMDGNNREKVSVANCLFIKGLIPIHTLNNLISFLISDRNIIDIESKCDEKFDLSFCTNMYSSNVQGMGCNKFILSLSIGHYPKYFPNAKIVIDNYFKFINETFYEELKDTPYMENLRNFRQLYYKDLKEKEIASFSEEDLKQFINLLTDEERRSIITSMNDDRFFEILNEYKKEKIIHK